MSKSNCINDAYTTAEFSLCHLQPTYIKSLHMNTQHTRAVDSKFKVCKLMLHRQVEKYLYLLM